jgi:hypothetical protein
MINETIQNSIGQLSYITFENWTAITTSTTFIIFAFIVWFIPIILYLIIGSIASGRTPSGQKLKKRAIQNPNYWIAIIVWFFVQALFWIIFIIYPLWLLFKF